MYLIHVKREFCLFVSHQTMNVCCLFSLESGNLILIELSVLEKNHCLKMSSGKFLNKGQQGNEVEPLHSCCENTMN